MTTKFTMDRVKNILNEEGYKLLSDSYKGSGKKINILCPKNHEWATTLNNFMSQKSRCPGCSDITNWNINSVRELLNKEGYMLITSIYNNMHQKIEMLCPKGHTYVTSLTNYIGNGCRCFTCSGIKRYSIEEIRVLFEKEGYKLITSQYKNAHQKLEVICPNNHATSFTMNDFISQESRCKYCAHNRPHSVESIRSFVEKEGYKLVSEIYNPRDKIDLICPSGHLYKTTFYNFKGHKRRCPACTEKGTSKTEKEILKWVSNFYPSARKEKIFYDPDNGKKFLELDIYVPEISLAIEYDGLIWHCEKYKEKKFHHNKTKIANLLGIRMLHIFSDEWEERKEQIKNYLLSVMNKNPISIGARKTDLKIVNKKEAESFLEENHIQGSATIGAAFGLYSNGELVAVMSGNKHHRQGQEGIFVLNRLAFKSEISVAGGSSKLLKALISYAKEQGYSRLISWSDNRWSEGRVYEKMGFTLEEDMGPDYSYIKREKRISKQSCQKKNLIKKGAIGTMANTEQELALSLGLYRIWDCGKKRWVMDLASK